MSVEFVHIKFTHINICIQYNDILFICTFIKLYGVEMMVMIIQVQGYYYDTLVVNDL